MARILQAARMISFFLILMLSITGAKALAASFPERRINVVVPFAAGSGVDLEARGIVPYVQKHIGVEVSIENVSGADGKIGLTRVWKSKPDGYNVIIHTATMSLIGESILGAEYRVADFSQIYCWSLSNQTLLVNSDSWKSLDEFIKAGRERPLSAGTAGRGSASHLNGIVLADELGIKVKWVPFDGSGEALAALAGKHIDFVVAMPTSALPLVKSGKIRPILTMGNSRDVVFPDAPIPKDLGHTFTTIQAIRGVDAPPKTDSAIVARLEEAFAKAAREPEFLSWAQKRKTTIVSLGHEEYRQTILSQTKAVEKYKNYLK